MSPVVLTILIAWALLSVMFLTGTLLAARSIDRSVAVIKPNVDEIGTEAGFIDQARTIQDTSTKINRAARSWPSSTIRSGCSSCRDHPPRSARRLSLMGRRMRSSA